MVASSSIKTTTNPAKNTRSKNVINPNSDHGRQAKKSGRKYYKSLDETLAHCDRTEKMDENYLLRPEQQNLNIVEVKNILGMKEEVYRDYKEFNGRKMPTNWIPYINGVITFSSSMQDDINKYGREKMHTAIKGFLKSEFGDIIIGVSLHMDETTPHCRFQAINYIKDKHKTFSSDMNVEIRKDKNRKNLLQDRLADYLAEHMERFDYVRGQAKTTKEYHGERKAQHNHLENLKLKLLETEAKLEDREKQLKLLEENYATLAKNRLGSINTNLESFVENNKAVDGNKFLKILRRYLSKSDKIT